MNAKVTTFINQELGVVHDHHDDMLFEEDENKPVSQYSYDRIKTLKLKIQRQRDKNVTSL